jgi:type VI secretion system VgrG family protein
MTAAPTQPVHFSFVTQAEGLTPETFKVSGFDGTEEISRPYRFDIDLVANDPEIDLDKLLYAAACLTIEKGDQVRKIHGLVFECRQADELPDRRYRYQVVLMPRIFLLSLSRQNQIYQNMTVPQIVAQEIKGDRAKDTTQHAKVGLFGDDFEQRLTRTYGAREYKVQYNESDFDFVARLMEHEGIFYFFEQGADREKMIITDDNVHFAGPKNAKDLPYRQASGLALSADEAMLSFACFQRRIPRQVVLRDYNYRLAASSLSLLEAQSEVDGNAKGVVCEYGDHFTSAEEGGQLARIRSQELYCAKRVFTGDSDSIRLQPGWRFHLSEHFRGSFNAEYVVTALIHRGRQPLQAAAGLAKGDGAQAAYGNQLTCIPADVPYRSPRRTPRPIISGLMTAHVDAAQLEDRAEMDDQGRYKLVMPFDLSGADPGKASRYVRKAQPYGGKEMGMHFPLHKGTEVICSFSNGDPDRPIIVGVVPNPDTRSVVTAENNTRNVIRTPSGVMIEINDGRPRG